MRTLTLLARPALRGVLTAATMAATLGLAGPARADRLTALVPAYFHPIRGEGCPWEALNRAAATIPIMAILNPASGPGTARSDAYARAVADLRAAGGRVIGYVSTAYGERDPEAVRADIRAYLDWYNVDGIFLDEMGDARGGLDYPDLYRYIKELADDAGRDLHVVGNPGVPFEQVKAYLAAADTLVIFEGPAANTDPNGPSFEAYPDEGPYRGLARWFDDEPRRRFANLIYDTPADAVRAALGKADQRNAGYVYVTDDRLPNPWDRLPEYWDREVAAIAALNAPPAPVALRLALANGLVDVLSWVLQSLCGEHPAKGARHPDAPR